MGEKSAKQLYEERQKKVVATRKERAAQLGKLTKEKGAIASATDSAGILAAVAHLSAGNRGALHRDIAVRMDAIVG